MISPTLDLVITLAILGAALYLIETMIPMAQPIKLIIRIIVVLTVVLLLLRLAVVI